MKHDAGGVFMLMLTGLRSHSDVIRVEGMRARRSVVKLVSPYYTDEKLIQLHKNDNDK